MFGDRWVQVNSDNPGWADRFTDVNSRVRVPFNYVNFFVVQFTHDRLDSNSPLTDTGAYRVDALLRGRDCHFGTLTRFAGN